MTEKMTEKITVTEASKQMGISPSELRYMLFERLVPFGVGYQKDDSSTRSYYIYPEKFREYIGAQREVDNG